MKTRLETALEWPLNIRSGPAVSKLCHQNCFQIDENPHPLVTGAGLVHLQSAAGDLQSFDASTRLVRRQTAALESPLNQWTTPAGTQVELPGMRPKLKYFAKVINYLKMQAIYLDMIKEKIINKPNKVFEFSGEKTGVDLLFELGLIDETSINHPPGKTTVQTITGNIPTHHVIAARFAGILEAGENGYWVICIPKSKYSTEDINSHMRAIVRRFQSQGMMVEIAKPMSPQSSDITNQPVLRG
jgi:hypothetical protein